MAALNYYLGIKRGANMQMVSVVAGTSSGNTAADVEVRIQINDGSNATNITRKDVVVALEQIEQWIMDGGLNHAGANLPAL